LIEWLKQDLKSDDPRVRHRLELEVKRFLNALANDQRCGTVAQNMFFTAIRSSFKKSFFDFLRCNYPIVHAPNAHSAVQT
jgi:hypothetical protein